MLIVLVSLAVGLLGLLATRAALPRLADRGPGGDPHVTWALGLVGLVPAWLITFVALLGASPAPRLPVWSAAAWIASSSAALIGTTLTAALARSASETGGRRRAPYRTCGPPA